MPLHPQARTLLDPINAMERVPSSDATLHEARAWLTMLFMLAGPAEEMHAVEDRDADGVSVRVYRPSAEPDLPVVVFLHGGGFTLGSVDCHDAIVRQLANASGALVVSVDYRLAPEHPFPAGLDDCWSALNWVAKRAAELGGDPGRLAIAGDSAGGNLSAVCALLARDAGEPSLALQVLIYPVVDDTFATESYRTNGRGYLLEEQQMRWFLDCYTRAGVDVADWRVAPLRAPNLAGVAPALVITAEFDPLRDEGEAYARRLRDAGVAVELTRYDGMIHAFFGLSAVFEDGRAALERAATVLRRAFGTLPG